MGALGNERSAPRLNLRHFNVPSLDGWGRPTRVDGEYLTRRWKENPWTLREGRVQEEEKE